MQIQQYGQDFFQILTSKSYSYNYVSASSLAHRPGQQGAVLYDATREKFLVHDGSSWCDMPEPVIHFGLTPRAEKILEWAERKMAQDAERIQLEADHPGLMAAREQYELMLALVQGSASGT
jgi:hypothetical protein